ncbi:Atrial natriuretic peptide receptor 2 [Tetrabaena socialis]|uniref:Atrial natriuretic peptide receptor 2 n=1 Tax=Tetrabaena socialis TaxID=47790 RepID=A0A2J8ABV8_9CHLO|nr:Atrial natriuretic peptide receptor 2 [Tetrabaena socialis]|eukprot:PNH09963.1 Atrial natriuretic peptide receptor 2 [Tetrabaena socialis]
MERSRPGECAHDRSAHAADCRAAVAGAEAPAKAGGLNGAPAAGSRAGADATPRAPASMEPGEAVEQADRSGATVYGLDLLRNASWRPDALKTVELHEEGAVMTGPTRLRAGMMGIVTRHAIFIDGAGPEETFGASGSAFNCSPCFEPATSSSPSRRFWGFVQINIDWEVLVHNVTRMYDLCDRMGLAFNMTYVDPVTLVNHSVAACGRLDPNPMAINIDIMQNHWVLCVSDMRGWTPDWLPLVVVVVVLVSVWVSAAMAIVMINRREHMWLLQAMLPDKVIAALRRGEDYAEAFENVTILFSDIVSYTSLASTIEPIKVVRLLNTMYSAFDALVDRYDCYKRAEDQPKKADIGDAFMAVCGTQGESPQQAAVRVARLAQAMVERTRALVSADGHRVQIRIGLHSGPVVGAVVGFKMPHFALCGDTVNTASRMESNSAPMRVHVSGPTAALLRASGQAFALQERGPVEVKGKGLMNTWWLLPPKSSENGASRSKHPGEGGGGVGGGGASRPSPSQQGGRALMAPPLQGQHNHVEGGGSGGGGGALAWLRRSEGGGSSSKRSRASVDLRLFQARPSQGGAKKV